MVLVFFLHQTRTTSRRSRNSPIGPNWRSNSTRATIVPGTGKIIYGLDSPDLKRITGSYYDPPGQTKNTTKFSLETDFTDEIKTTKLMESGQFQVRQRQ
jgi:hypothetical protein